MTQRVDDDAIVRFALGRDFAYRDGGGLPLWVIDHRPIAAFPKVGYDPMERFPAAAAGLRGISSAFRLIYDPHTKRRDDPEFKAIHLYSEFEGVMLHETSCQWDMSKPWPHGLPCSPRVAWEGRGIVAWAKAHDKARMQGNPDQIQRAINKSRCDYNDKLRATFDGEAKEFDDYVVKEIRKINTTSSVGFSTCKTLEIKPEKRKQSSPAILQTA